MGNRSVAPFVTWMKPFSVYTVSAESVRLAVMSVVRSAFAFPNDFVVTLDSLDGAVDDPSTVITRYRYSVATLSGVSVYVTVPAVVGAGMLVAVQTFPSRPRALDVVAVVVAFDVNEILTEVELSASVVTPMTAVAVGAVGPSSLPHAAAKPRTVIVDTAAKRRSIDMRMTSSAANCWRGRSAASGRSATGFKKRIRQRDYVMNSSRRRHTDRLTGARQGRLEPLARRDTPRASTFLSWPRS
jgi:hypothetical protein